MCIISFLSILSSRAQLATCRSTPIGWQIFKFARLASRTSQWVGWGLIWSQALDLDIVSESQYSTVHGIFLVLQLYPALRPPTQRGLNLIPDIGYPAYDLKSTYCFCAHMHEMMKYFLLTENQ